MPLPDPTRLFEAVFDDEAYCAVIGEISDAIGARSFTAGFLFEDGTSVRNLASPYWGTDQSDDYFENYFHLDPFNHYALANWRPQRAIDYSQELPDGTFERSPVYQEFIRGIGDDTFRAVGVCLEIADGRGAVSFQRGRTQTDFDADLVAELDAIAPQLARSMAVRGRLQGLERALIERDLMLDSLSEALLVLDTSGRLVHANRAGEARLRDGDVLRMARGVVVGAGRHNARQITDALACVRLHREASALLAGNDGALQVGMVAMPAAAGPDRVLVSFRGPTLFGRKAALRRLHGLSQSEAEIALQLAAGKTPAEIAEDRRTSLNTVRVQIRSVTEKMGCSRQLDIVRKVETLPLIAALRD